MRMTTVAVAALFVILLIMRVESIILYTVFAAAFSILFLSYYLRIQREQNERIRLLEEKLKKQRLG